MAFRHVPPHPGSPWQHVSGLAIGLILLALLAGLALYLQQSRYPVLLPAEPAVVAPAAPLDQHERHPALIMPAAPLDQHERHPELIVPAAAPLDQHERHPSTN